MNVREHDKCVEHVESLNNIDIAFTSMVRRWLVRGNNGEWQLPPATSRRKVETERLAQQGDDAPSRKRKPQPVEQSSGKAKQKHEEVNAHHIHNKLTNEFLERSKTRLLSCTRAQLRLRTHEGSDVSPKVSQTVTTDSVPSTAGESEDFHVRLRTRPDVKDKHVTSSTQAKKTRKTSQSAFVLGKCVTGPLTGKCAQKIKKISSSQANSGNKKHEAISGSSNAKKEVESKFDKRAMSAQPRGSADKKEHANDYPLTSRQTSSAILVLCNGQRKCKVEGCYKAAYQRGRCPSHGGQNQGRSQRCTNYSYSQSSCQTHGGKSHTNHRDTNCSTVESSSGGSKTDTPAPLAHQTVHDDSSHDKSSKANSNNHTSKSTNLQSNKKFSTAPTSDAWHSSDLSNRFRSASSKRTEKAVQSVKQENTSPQENPLVTKRRRTIVKATTNKCKVRTCKQNTVTNGFCHVHSKREICQHEDCSNLTPKNAVSGMCTRHGGHKKCEINGCVANAQYYGLCRKHGGSPICRERGCSRPAHSRGFCSAHFRVVQDQASDPLQPRSPSYTRLKTEEDGG